MRRTLIGAVALAALMSTPAVAREVRTRAPAASTAVAKAALSKAKPTSAKAATARPKRAAKPVVAAPVLVLSPQIGDAIYKGTFAGNDCVGGFSTCYATQTGVQQGPGADPLASPAVYKFNFGGEDESSPLFATIDGTEFQISYDEATNFLSFLYSPGAGDPELHYFSIKQANDYALFYDADAILAGGIDLDNYFASNPGFSHITFFDTRPGGGTGGDGGTGGVPEPSTWAMMLLGFGGMGLAMRRRRRNGTLMQQMA